MTKIDKWVDHHAIASTLIYPFVQPYDPGIYLNAESNLAWHEAKEHPQVAAVVAAIATWYIGGAGAAAIGFEYGTTANVVIAGAASGAAGGFVGARASGASLNDSFQSAGMDAAIGASLAYIGCAVLKTNPSTQFTWSDAKYDFETSEIRYEFGRFTQHEFGIQGWEVDLGMIAASYAGNYLAGSPVDQVKDNNGNSGIGGFFSRGKSLLFDDGSGLLHKIVDFPFDVNDTILQYQGLPDATDLQIMHDGLKPTFAHSLGTLRESNLAAWGYVNNVTAYALPFGFCAPSGVLTIYIGSDDPVTGWSLGKVFNPDAKVLPTDHYMVDYNAATQH